MVILVIRITSVPHIQKDVIRVRAEATRVVVAIRVGEAALVEEVDQVVVIRVEAADQEVATRGVEAVETLGVEVAPQDKPARQMVVVAGSAKQGGELHRQKATAW